MARLVVDVRVPPFKWHQRSGRSLPDPGQPSTVLLTTLQPAQVLIQLPYCWIGPLGAPAGCGLHMEVLTIHFLSRGQDLLPLLATPIRGGFLMALPRRR